jgi:hypothetical protein
MHLLSRSRRLKKYIKKQTENKILLRTKQTLFFIEQRTDTEPNRFELKSYTVFRQNQKCYSVTKRVRLVELYHRARKTSAAVMLTLMSGSKFFIFYFFAKKKSVVDSARRQTDALTMQLHRLFNHALFFKHAFLVLNVHGRQTLQRDFSQMACPCNLQKTLSLSLTHPLSRTLSHTHTPPLRIQRFVNPLCLKLSSPFYPSPSPTVRECLFP